MEGAVPAAEDLCLSCGLCCDGTLFDLVRLEAGDDADRLRALGMTVTVSRGRSPVARIAQPCAALCADRRCRIYASRPAQCRQFECGLLKDAKAGRIEWGAAHRATRQARRQADKVRRLLRALGDADESRSLGERFHRVAERLEAGGGDAATHARFADLSLAVHRLKLLAFPRFYTPPETATTRACP